MAVTNKKKISKKSHYSTNTSLNLSRLATPAKGTGRVLIPPQLPAYEIRTEVTVLTAAPRTADRKSRKIDEEANFFTVDRATKLKAVPKPRPFSSRPSSKKWIRGFERFKQPPARDSSLDFKILVEKPDRNKGPTIGVRRQESVPTTKRGPGPGSYSPKHICSQSMSITFGKEKRKLDLDKPSDNHISQIQSSEFYNFGKKHEKKGYSFPMEQRNHIEGFTGNPGPGYYSLSTKSIMAKTTGFTFSSGGVLPLESKRSKIDIDFINSKSSIMLKTNYQKFSNAARFPTKGRYCYRRYLNVPSSTPKTMIEGNQRNQSFLNQEDKRKRYKSNIIRLDQKIVLAQAKKLKLEEKDIQLKLKHIEEVERRKLINREKSHSWKIELSWVELLLLGEWLRKLGEKFELHKKLRVQTNKYLKIMFVTLWAIGKIRKIIQANRLRKMTNSLKRIVSIKSGLWKLRHKIKMKKNVGEFIQRYATASKFALFVMKIDSGVRVIQHWFRRYLAKKTLMLGILNEQWSVVECAVLNLRNTSEESNSKILQQIEYCIKQNIRSERVPPRVRIYFITKYLNELNSKFFEKIQQYRTEFTVAKQQALDKHEFANVKRILNNLPKLPFAFVPPRPPPYHIFIRRLDMVNLVNQSLINRIEWDDIIEREKPFLCSKSRAQFQSCSPRPPSSNRSILPD